MKHKPIQKIIILTNAHSGGGAERAMNLLANALIGLEYQVKVIAINCSLEDVISYNFERETLGRNPDSGVVKTLLSFLKFQYSIYDWNPDIIILACELPELFGAFCITRRPIIISCQTNKPWQKRKLLGKIVRKTLSLRIPTWISTSSHFNIWPFDLRPSLVIENIFLSPRVLSGNKLKKIRLIKRLVFIGRLSEEKDPKLVLQVASLVKLPVIMIGEGSLMNSLKSFAKTTNVEANFLGFVKYPWDETKLGDLLLVPSFFEGDGLVVLEGMVRGIPIILKDIPEFRRFQLQDRNYADNPKDFCDTIERYRKCVSELCAPNNTSKEILISRSPNLIGKEWESAFKWTYLQKEKVRYQIHVENS